MQRLPSVRQSTDTGYVYVVERDGAHKIGFTRKALKRRVRACDGRLLLAIPTKQHVSALEHLLHQRFADKRTEGPGFKREWFSLDNTDIDWLRKLATTIASGPDRLPEVI